MPESRRPPPPDPERGRGGRMDPPPKPPPRHPLLSIRDRQARRRRGGRMLGMGWANRVPRIADDMEEDGVQSTRADPLARASRPKARGSILRQAAGMGNLSYPTTPRRKKRRLVIDRFFTCPPPTRRNKMICAPLHSTYRGANAPSFLPYRECRPRERGKNWVVIRRGWNRTV